MHLASTSYPARTVLRYPENHWCFLCLCFIFSLEKLAILFSLDSKDRRCFTTTSSQWFYSGISFVPILEFWVTRIVVAVDSSSFSPHRNHIFAFLGRQWSRDHDESCFVAIDAELSRIRLTKKKNPTIIRRREKLDFQWERKRKKQKSNRKTPPKRANVDSSRPIWTHFLHEPTIDRHERRTRWLFFSSFFIDSPGLIRDKVN